VFNFCTLLYYDPGYLGEKEGATQPPQWIYWTWGISLFMYQSLDAIDGCASLYYMQYNCADIVTTTGSRREGLAWLVLLAKCSTTVSNNLPDNCASPAYLSTLGCDALNTTVRNSRLLIPNPGVHDTTARSDSRVKGSEPLSIPVDRLVSDGHSCKFLPHHLGGVPYRYGH